MMHPNFFESPTCPTHGHELLTTPLRHQMVCPDQRGCDYYERIEPLKLYNTIIIFDVYAVAKSPEAANEAVKAWIKSGELAPSSENALEAREERNIRASWLDERPIIGDDLTDEEFKSLKGKSTAEAFTRFYKK